MEAALPAGRGDPLLESQVSSKHIVKNAGLVSLSNFWKSENSRRLYLCDKARAKVNQKEIHLRRIEI